MYKGQKIGVVVPAHNEERHIKDVILTSPDFVDVIVITDDCSTDSTASTAEDSGDPRVKVIRHTDNTGVGGAIITSHKEALAQGCDINVVMAGDGQMDPNYLAQLLDPVVAGECGYAKGNRLFSRSSHSGMPKYRIMGNYVLTYMHKSVSGYWNVTDPQNGYTAIRTDLLETIDYENIAQGYEFENEMLVKLNENNIPVKDIAIPAVYGSEVSGIRLSVVIPALLKNFFSSYFSRMFNKYIKPGKIIPILSMLVWVAGAIGLVAGVVTVSPSIFAISMGLFVLGAAGVSVYDIMAMPKAWDPPRPL